MTNYIGLLVLSKHAIALPESVLPYSSTLNNLTQEISQIRSLVVVTIPYVSVVPGASKASCTEKCLSTISNQRTCPWSVIDA